MKNAGKFKMKGYDVFTKKNVGNDKILTLHLSLIASLDKCRFSGQF